MVFKLKHGQGPINGSVVFSFQGQNNTFVFAITFGFLFVIFISIKTTSLFLHNLIRFD